MGDDTDETTATRKKKVDGTIVGSAVTADTSTWNIMLGLLPAIISDTDVHALVVALKAQNAE